ncbi:MAG: thioredoxin domain-containing protein [Myxococcales bacterium]
MDTEQPSSATFLAKFPIDSWPTLLIVDPKTERAAVRWLGNVTVEQLASLLDEGKSALRRQKSPGDPASQAEAQVAALSEAGRWRECAAQARATAPRLSAGHPRSDVVGTGLLCALQDPGPPGKAEVAALLPLAMTELGDARQLADDRSSLYEALVLAHQQGGDRAGARRLARDWLAFLNEEARGAANAEARSALDGHRLEAARALGDASLALPALLRSQRELPADFDPSERLALAEGDLGRYPAALAASERAFDLAVGPRRLRILRERADIYARMGDGAARDRTLREALELAARLPMSQRPAAEIEKLRRELATRVESRP